MKRGLRFRLSLFMIGVASGILLIAGISLIAAAHYHFMLYQDQFGVDHNLPGLTFHLEQALLQSMIWTIAGAVLLAVLISLYIAKRLSDPLVEMKHAAEQITRGKLDVRTSVTGSDEIADLGKALNHLSERLQQQEQLRAMMTQDIAHELRTPLATLKSHMLAMIDQVWEPTPKRLQACYDETERLISLVADLEQLTFMESPQFRLQRKPEDLSALFRHSVEIVTAAYLEKEVRLLVRPHASIHLLLDRDRFIQIMANVLSNALKFTAEGGQVEIRTKEENGTVLIAVQDTGSGIHPADLPYVFERFYRADKSRSRKSGGGGIGLTIVKKLVEAHGGTVWIESAKGTTIYMRFPKSVSQQDIMRT